MIGAIAPQSNSGANPDGLSDPPIGQAIPDFKLPDISGIVHSFSSMRGEKGTLLVFISTKCPYSNAYNERVKKIAEDYQARGGSFIGINASANETADEIKRHADEHKFSFPILKDVDNRIADQLNAQVTPEAYLLDSGGKLIYHGRIDNSRILDQVKSNDLRDAIGALLAGKPIENPRTRAFGCMIQRVKK
jgi:peroxiredoxin